MNIDPEKLFICLMDFFSILLPGALLTYLLMGPVALGDRYAKLAGAQALAAFLFASYLFGHLVFLLGSWLDEFYDWARRYALNTQIALPRPPVAMDRPHPDLAGVQRRAQPRRESCRQDQAADTWRLLGRILQSRASKWE